jgi:hypothetical protein
VIYALSKFYPPLREKKDEELGAVGAVIAEGTGINKDDSKKRDLFILFLLRFSCYTDQYAEV